MLSMIALVCLELMSQLKQTTKLLTKAPTIDIDDIKADVYLLKRRRVVTIVIFTQSSGADDYCND